MRRYLPLLAVFLLLFGCVAENPYSEVERESKLSLEPVDFDDDGTADAYIYKSVRYEPGNADVYLQRTVYILANRGITGVALRNMSAVQATEVKISYNDLVGFEEDELDSCSASLGLQNLQCPDENTCTKICSQYSPSCKLAFNNYPDILGYSIVSFQKYKLSVINRINSLQNEIFSIETLPESGVGSVIEDLLDVKHDMVALYVNPVYLSEDVKLCSYSQTPLKVLNQLQGRIADVTTEEKDYEYLVMIKVESKPDEGYEDVFLRDLVPVSYTAGSLFSTQDMTVDGSTVSWPSTRPYSDKEQYLFYSFASDIPPDGIIWNTPSIKTRMLDLSALGLSFALFDILIFFGNYYFALALSLGIPVVLLVVVINALLLGVFMLKANLEKKSRYRAVKDWAGVPNQNWKKDVIFGAVMMLIGVGFSFFAAEVTDQHLDIFSAFDNVFNDYAALISVFCLLFGIALIYAGAQSNVKAMLLESTYKGILVEDKEAAMSNLRELKDKAARLKSLIDQLGGEEFDVSDAYRVYTSVSVRNIEKMIEEKDTTKNPRVMRELNMVENAYTLLKEKKENAESNWPKWKEYMAGQLEQKEQVYLSSLISIPHSLRIWAANRYLKENPGAGVILEGELMKKSQTAPKAVVDQLIASGLIKGAVVLKGEKPVLTNISEGNPTVISVLALRMSAYLKTFLKKRDQKEYKYVMGIGNRKVFILLRKGETEALIFSEKEKFKEAIDSWKEVMKRL